VPVLYRYSSKYRLTTGRYSGHWADFARYIALTHPAKWQQTLDLILSMKMAILLILNIMVILVFKLWIDGGQICQNQHPFRQTAGTASKNVSNLYKFARDLLSKMPENT
jgi:hypothetical protein